MASSVSLTDAAKNLYVSDEASLILVLCCLDQYGPIVARTPSPVSERRFSKSNNIEDKYAAQRQGIGDALKKGANKIVSVYGFAVVGQRFTDGDDCVVVLNRHFVGGGVNEVRGRHIRTRYLQQLG